MTLQAVSGNVNHVYDHILALEPNQEMSISDVFHKYGISLLMQETSHEELRDLDADLPSDTHLVSYKTKDGDFSSDAVRAYKISDIFDAYHDSELKVISIQSGYGRVKPKLYTGK